MIGHSQYLASSHSSFKRERCDGQRISNSRYTTEVLRFTFAPSLLCSRHCRLLHQRLSRNILPFNTDLKSNWRFKSTPFSAPSFRDASAFIVSFTTYTHTHTPTHIHVCVCVYIYSYCIRYKPHGGNNSRRFTFSGRLRCVNWEMITSTYVLFESEDVGSLFLRRVGNYLPADIG
jgi:hypothetical protein